MSQIDIDIFQKIKAEIEKEAKRDVPLVYSQEEWDHHILTGEWMRGYHDKDVVDYSGNNIGDAFELGEEAGSVDFARKLLAIIKKEEENNE